MTAPFVSRSLALQANPTPTALEAQRLIQAARKSLTPHEYLGLLDFVANFCHGESYAVGQAQGYWGEDQEQDSFMEECDART